MKSNGHFHAFVFSIFSHQTLNFVDKLMPALMLIAIDFQSMLYCQMFIVFPDKKKNVFSAIFYCSEIGSNCL